ncbi:hypothetical protein GW17_00058131 [Ensete ventricosum]|nr:hypothetical protein GW17_00058131 [Ensete ventricosum]
MAHNSQVSLAVCRSTALPPASSLMSPPLPWTSSSSLLFSLVCFALSVHTEVLTGHRYVDASDCAFSARGEYPTSRCLFCSLPRSS